MTLAGCLGRILKEEIRESHQPGGFFVLRETKVMRVEVSGLTADAAVIRLDRIGALKGVTAGPWKQVCDYVIVSPGGEVVGDPVRVLFVELKRTLTDEVKGFEQLRRSLPLLQYLRAPCRIECGSDSEQPHIRYALVAARGNPRLDKQPVRPRRTPLKKGHEDIEVTLHVAGSRVGFSKPWGD